jgi:hypothetical protein
MPVVPGLYFMLDGVQEECPDHKTHEMFLFVYSPLIKCFMVHLNTAYKHRKVDFDKLKINLYFPVDIHHLVSNFIFKSFIHDI